MESRVWPSHLLKRKMQIKNKTYARHRAIGKMPQGRAEISQGKFDSGRNLVTLGTLTATWRLWHPSEMLCSHCSHCSSESRQCHGTLILEALRMQELWSHGSFGLEARKNYAARLAPSLSAGSTQENAVWWSCAIKTPERQRIRQYAMPAWKVTDICMQPQRVIMHLQPAESLR